MENFKTRCWVVCLDLLIHVHNAGNISLDTPFNCKRWTFCSYSVHLDCAVSGFPAASGHQEGVAARYLLQALEVSLFVIFSAFLYKEMSPLALPLPLSPENITVFGTLPESIEWFIEGRASGRRMIWLLTPIPTLSPSVKKLDRRHTRDWERETSCWRESGGRSQIISVLQRGSLVLC